MATQDHLSTSPCDRVGQQGDAIHRGREAPRRTRRQSPLCAIGDTDRRRLNGLGQNTKTSARASERLRHYCFISEFFLPRLAALVGVLVDGSVHLVRERALGVLDVVLYFPHRGPPASQGTVMFPWRKALATQRLAPASLTRAIPMLRQAACAWLCGCRNQSVAMVKNTTP